MEIKISITGTADEPHYPLEALIDLLSQAIDDLSNSAILIANEKSGYPIFGDFKDDDGNYLRVEVKTSNGTN